MLRTGPIGGPSDAVQHLVGQCPESLEMRASLDAFFEITARWRLTQSQRRLLLGSPTDERWFHFIREPHPRLTPLEFSGVQAVVQLDAALSNCVHDPYEATRWLHTLAMGSPFLGRTPLALLLGGMDDFKAVADYLKSQRSNGRASVSG
jgi:hypothetical protein